MPWANGLFDLRSSPSSDRFRAEDVVAVIFFQVIWIVPRLQLGKYDGTASSMDRLGTDEYGMSTCMYAQRAD